jgi:death-on-curing protein
MKTYKLSLEEMEFIVHRLAQELLVWNEPIPDFSTRFDNILESCLEIPFQTFGKKVLYKGIVGKAAMLLYLLVKNHPFKNGNKRIAVTALLVLLHKNGKWLEVSQQKLYNMAVFVAKSDPQERDIVIGAIRAFIKDYLTDL